MTNRQSNCNPVVPTRREVRWAILQALAAGAVYVWMWWGDGLHAAVGLIGWTLIMFHTTGKAFDVTRARGRMLMELTAERARNTGTWEDDCRGDLWFTVRWEPSVGWFVRGTVGTGHEPDERQVDEVEALAVIVAAEADGYVAWEDEGTRSVRARLDLPGWDDTEHPLVTEIKAGTHPLGGPLGDLWDEPARDLTAYRNRFKPGPY